MTLTLDQQRAQRAWNDITEVDEKGKLKEYTSLAKSTASLIMNSGLMQTLAFLQAKAKAKSQDEHELLLQHLLKWLGNVLGGDKIHGDERFPPEPVADFQLVMEALYQSSPDLYMRATSETMEFLRWIRHFADAQKALRAAS